MTATMLATERITISDTIIDQARSVPVSDVTSMLLQTSDGETISLPAELQKVLLATLTSISDATGVTISRLPEELTSTVAAELLDVSRPTLMKWAREGTIDSFKVGTHTRFARDEVLRLRKARAAERRAAFGELRAFDEEHDEVFDD